MYNPLGDARLRDLLEIEDEDNLILLNRENEKIEYKVSFHLNDVRVIKTFAAFANNAGGYIVFGVKDTTRELVGLSENHTKKFAELDANFIAQQLHKYFAPTIYFTPQSHKIRGKNIGIIYVHESKYKPIVVTTVGHGGKLREGDVFFSYEASRERIKYAEFSQILEERSTRHIQEFMKHIDTIMNIGVDNTAIINTDDGSVIGPKIKSFMIDDELLDTLKFIKEGEFNHKKGDPTLRLIGDLVNVTDETFPIKTYLSKEDIFNDFLHTRNVGNPYDYLKAVCVKHFETTW